jgi:hypothetical protein
MSILSTPAADSISSGASPCVTQNKVMTITLSKRHRETQVSFLQKVFSGLLSTRLQDEQGDAGVRPRQRRGGAEDPALRVAHGLVGLLRGARVGHLCVQVVWWRVCG